MHCLALVVMKYQYLHGGQFLLHLSVLLSQLIILVFQFRQTTAESRKHLVSLQQLTFNILDLKTSQINMELHSFNMMPRLPRPSCYSYLVL